MNIFKFLFCVVLIPSVSLSAPRFEKVITIVFENKNFSKALNTGYFKELAAQGALFKNFYAQTRPSQPNYFSMISGSEWGHYSNEPVLLDQLTIVDLLEAQNKTWAVFAEDYPGNCFTEKNHKTYVKKHNPFMSFKNIVENPQRCSRILNLDAFFSAWDQNQLPHYSFIVPGNSSNGHDTSIDYASDWFKKLFSAYISNIDKMKDTLFIITFDEAGLSLTNQIYTVLVGPSVVAGSKNYENHNHYSLLKLIQDEWHLGNLGQGDADATPILDIWEK